ncbi:MAG: hypothetical protein ACJAZO_004153 [Myxococcota bacterium]|jgi:hypothetical protein
MKAPAWLRVVAVVLFGLLLGEALTLAPPSADGTGAQVMDWMTGAWSGYEPMMVAHFQLMGVWPFVLAAMCGPWLRGRRIPLWPFALGSMALGAFALLPGLAVPRSSGESVPVLRSRWMAPVLGVPTLALLGWAAVAGDPAVWWQAFRTEQFIHIMGLDFVVLWLTSIAVAHARDGRGWVCAIPLVGALFWLWTQPAQRS